MPLHDHGSHGHHVHAHAHGHGHGHVHGRLHGGAFTRAFAIGSALNLVYVAVEATMGWQLDSVALLADAGHNLSDVLALLLAWGGAALAQRAPTARHSYGLRGSTILAALANAVLLLLVIGAVAWEAIGRLRAPAPVAGGTVAMVAAFGILVNGATAFAFMRGRDTDLNVRGAYLHMLADAGVSAAVVAGGLTMRATGWLWIDPVMSLIVVLVIGVSTWGLLRDSVNLALHAAPAGIDPQAVQHYLESLPGVEAVHDLHVWGMSTTDTALTAHLVRPNVADDDAFLRDVAQALHDRFAIEHVTLQVERCASPPCRLAPAHVV